MLNSDSFPRLTGAQRLIERWVGDINEFRLHSALNSQHPDPEIILIKWQINGLLRLLANWTKKRDLENEPYENVFYILTVYAYRTIL